MNFSVPQVTRARVRAFVERMARVNVRMNSVVKRAKIAAQAISGSSVILFAMGTRPATPLGDVIEQENANAKQVSVARIARNVDRTCTG